MPVATINGTNLSFVEKGTGEPVLFAHGGLADQRVWHRQIEVFAEQYRAIAVSCRGYWPNGKLRDDETITLDTFVDDLVEFIRALGSGPVHLIGHSSPGGFASLRLARQDPELLRSLVVLEPPAFPLLGLNIPPRPAQLLKLLLRDRRTAIDFIKFGARTMSPAVRAFERGNDEQAVRIFLAGNGSDSESIAKLPHTIGSRCS